MKRPLHSHLLDMLAKAASYLCELKQKLMEDMMTDFLFGVDHYLEAVRGLPDDSYEANLVSMLISLLSEVLIG